uniref:Uncharacterized protein n=1 Tax=Anguilla anguilla TaxID=7936 RepID=A0A0E9VE22_ANGAN
MLAYLSGRLYCAINWTRAFCRSTMR